MIDVDGVLESLPRFRTFCSVKKMHDLVDEVAKDSRFQVRVVGASTQGVPIHHVRFGSGATKFLAVGFPHCMEPIGGLTIFSLLTLLLASDPSLAGGDVEWNFVPCADPDGAMLNEAWTQEPFSLSNYIRGHFVQSNRHQIDGSFPIHYKNLEWNQPTREAEILKGVLDEVRPDFYFWLHNATIGGAFYFLSEPLGESDYEQLFRLLDRNAMPLQRRPIHKDISRKYADGIVELPSIRRWYDYIERTTPSPDLQTGETSAGYLAQIKPDALIFVAEMGYVRHPDDESEILTSQNLRHFKLRVEADIKFLAAAVIEEWNRVEAEIDRTSPFFDAVDGIMPTKEGLRDGAWPIQRYPTSNTLFEPANDRIMTEGDRLDACMVDGGFMFLKLAYQFVRLLKASNQSAAVQAAIARLDREFDAAYARLGEYIDLSAFEAFDCDTLCRVQLGSGLIALNAVLGRASTVHSRPSDRNFAWPESAGPNPQAI